MSAVRTQVSDGGGEVGPVERYVKDVAEHGRRCSSQDVAQMLGIGEGIGNEDTAWQSGGSSIVLERGIGGVLVAEDGGHERDHGFDFRQERSAGTGERLKSRLAGLAVGVKALADVGDASTDAAGAICKLRGSEG